MSVKPNKLIISALALSGLVHGGLVFYAADISNYGEPLSIDAYISVSLQASAAQKTDVLNKSQVKKSQQKKAQNKQLSASAESLRNIKSNALESIESKEDDGLDVSNKMDEELAKQVRPPNKQDALDSAEQELKVLSGEDRDLILGLLHDEISENKKYPFLAIRQRREGLVTVNFVLHPDGHISDVSVVRSSRNDLLDSAAKLAVEKVSPFMMAENYLHQSELFNVDIEFRLN